MHNNNRFPRRLLVTATTLGSLVLAGQALATELAELSDHRIEAEVEALFGVFHSDSGYATGAAEDRSHRWQEGYLELGVALTPKEAGLYGRVSAMATGTWGEGDAGGFTSGNERALDIEDAYLGWRQEGLGGSPWFLDVSLGRQNLMLGDGFLLAGDALNLGDALGSELDRGGAYYLAPRQAFDRSAVVRTGRDGWQAQLAWLESDNVAQASTELAALTLTHDFAAGEVEASYLRGLGVDTSQADDFLVERDGMDVYSLRGTLSLMDDALGLRGEVAQQRKSSHEMAWYLEPSWTFTQVAGQPTVSLRYSRFDEAWDPLFFGFGRGYGTWFQGEVAGNYAGPFNSNAEVWHLGVSAEVNEQLQVGALAFHFSTLDSVDQPNMGGKELNLYAEWFPTEQFYVSPLIGWYDPDRSADQGGIQLGGDGSSAYAQLLVGVFF